MYVQTCLDKPLNKAAVTRLTIDSSAITIEAFYSYSSLIGIKTTCRDPAGKEVMGEKLVTNAWNNKTTTAHINLLMPEAYRCSQVNLERKLVELIQSINLGA